jgi:radical SAM superfamily enzyme YgiQ (UPF0313 family)
MSLLLVHPPVTEENRVSSGYKVHRSLGMVSLATYLVTKGVPRRDIRLMDCLDYSLESILSEASKGYDFVGLSTNLFNYGNALKVAEVAHSCGSKTILGGPHPTSCPELILRNRPFVDYCILEKGETALHTLMRDTNPADIPSLAYREHGKPVTNPRERVDLNTLPIPNWELFGKDTEKIPGSFPGTEIRRFLPFQGHAGCVWREKKGCGFCAIPDGAFQGKNPKRFWEDVTYLSNKFHLDLLFDIGDDFTAKRDWVERLVTNKPEGTPKLFVYGKANEMDQTMVSWLASLNVYMVYLGVESGSDKMLRGLMKGVSVQQTKYAAKLLSDNGIRVTGTFVLGMPGETTETLRTSVKLMEELAATCKTYNISANPVVPYHGTRFFAEFLRTHKGSQYRNKDLYSVRQIERDFIEAMTHVSPERVSSTIAQVNGIGGGNGIRYPDVVEDVQRVVWTGVPPHLVRSAVWRRRGRVGRGRRAVEAAQGRHASRTAAGECRWLAHAGRTSRSRRIPLPSRPPA